MNIVAMVEYEVTLREAILKIRCVDSDAPDERVLRRRMERVAERAPKTTVEIAEIVYMEICRTGKTAEEIIRKMEEDLIHE